MAREPGREPCAVEAGARGDLLAGTASRERRWLLVEQPGAWGRDALTESHMPPGIAAKLAATAAEHRVRIVLIRRSARPAHPASVTVFMAHTAARHRWAERFEVAGPSELAHLDLSVLDRPDPPGVGDAVDAVDLVCTNGRHDPCCADWGRPAHRALTESGVDAWECSHIGGDRFAANVVCLPTGVYFGRVPPERAAAIVTDHHAGLLDLDCYRGRSFLPPLVQAAEVLARQELGERRLAQLGLVEWERNGDTALVELALEGSTIEVRVSRRRMPAVKLTCGPSASVPWAYRLEGLTPAPARQ